MSNVPAVRKGQAALVPAGATPDILSFDEMLRRAEVMAKTDLVPKPLQGKPEAIVVVGVWGAEHGVSLMTAIQEVHVIENKPSPSAQLRLALIRRAGHEVRWIETAPTKAVIQGRRSEYHRDPNAWTTVEYTIEMARQAGLLDEWAERWVDRRPQRWTVGDDTGRRDLSSAPEWVQKAVANGDVRSKDNWRKYPADMLRARAASVLARMEFSDVMAALDAHQHTAEELGIDIGQDLDEPTEVDTIPSEEQDGDGEEVEDAVIVEDPAPGPEVHPPNPMSSPPTPGGTTPQAGERVAPDADAGRVAQTPACGQTPVPPMPEVKDRERDDISELKTRIRLGITPKGWAGLIPWLEACGMPATLDGLTRARVAAVDAELDKRGVARLPAHSPEDVPPPPSTPTRTDG